MARWWKAGIASLLGLSLVQSAFSQTPVVRSGYLVIRVIVDSIDGAAVAQGGPGAGGGPAVGGAPGIGGGGSPDGGESGPPGRGGGPGGPPGAGGFGPPGGLGGGGNVATLAQMPKSVVVCVPFTNMTREPLYNQAGMPRSQNPLLNSIKTKYGKTFLFSDNSSIQFYPYFSQTLEANLRQRHADWSKNRNLPDGYRLCKDALTYGMLEEALTYSRELAKQVEIKKDSKPPVDIQEFVSALATFEANIDTPPSKPSDAESWRQRVQGEKISESTHYALIHPQEIPAEEVNRRLTTLERNFKAFYLWHAMSRKAAKLPEKKLVVILPKSATDVDRLKKGLDGSTIVTDATFTQFHNIVVLSPERLDDVSRSFQNLTRQIWSIGYNPDELIKGVAPRSFANRGPQDHARAMTLALVSKAMEDEADFAALSREGSRQLYIASGIFPQNVMLPEWLEFGSSSLFQKPKGPVFAKQGNANVMAVGLVAGYGTPNFHYRRHFLALQKSDKLNPKPAEILLNVLTNQYFDAARDGKDIDPPPVRAAAGGAGGQPGGPTTGSQQGPGGRPGPGAPGPRGPGGPPGGVAPGPVGGGGGEIGEPGMAGGQTGPDPNLDPEEREKELKKELLVKAETMSWALLYYLSKERLAGLHDFYAQLHRMPRDLHLDERTVLKVFCRSFNLLKGDEIDPEEFDRFAKAWIEYMKTTPWFHLDVPIRDLNSDPSVGGGAGGLGGPGGGGPFVGGQGGGPGGRGGP